MRRWMSATILPMCLLALNDAYDGTPTTVDATAIFKIESPDAEMKRSYPNGNARLYQHGDSKRAFIITQTKAALEAAMKDQCGVRVYPVKE